MTQLTYNCDDRSFVINLPDHAAAHVWKSGGQPGSDLVNVHPRMFTLLRTTVVPNSVILNITPFYYIKEGTFTVYSGGNYNLTPHIPTTPNHIRLVMIGLDTVTNTITAYNGAETFNSASTPAPLPSGLADTFIPSAVIRLPYGATAVSEINISDARIFLHTSGGGGGWPYSTLTVDPTNTNAAYPTITAAIAAAAVGDRVQFDSVTEKVNVNKVITLAGINNGAKLSLSSDTPVLTISSAANLDNFTVEQTYAAAASTAVIVGADATLRNLRIRLPSGGAFGHTGLYVSSSSGAILYNCDIEVVNSTSGYGLYTNLLTKIIMVGGRIKSSGGSGTNYACYADNNSDIILIGTFVESGVVGGAGRVGGWYIDSNYKVVILDRMGYSYFSWGAQNSAPTLNVVADDLYMDDGTNIGNGEPAFRTYIGGVWRTLSDPSIQPGGAWVHRVDGLRVKYATLDAAMTAAVAGDKIKLYAGTYTVTNALPLDVAIEIEGDGPDKTTITCATNNNATIDVTANATLRNLTVTNTGAGASAAGPVAMSNVTLNLDNVRLTKSSGAPAIGYGIWMYNAGTLVVKNGTVISCTAGTSKYGIYHDLNNATVFLLAGCEVGGSTFDIYSNQSGAAVNLEGCKLTNANHSWAGVIRGRGLDSLSRVIRRTPLGVFDGRLTLQSNTPVPTGDIAAATTLYLTPAHDTGGSAGRHIEVYNGYFWIEAPFGEISLSLSGFTTGMNSDIFVYDNAGTLTLERTEWTNDTTRATGLAAQDGRWVKSGALTRLYCGTIRTSGTGTCDDTVLARFVWNNYNKVKRNFSVANTNAHTYDSTFRPFNNTQAASQVECVVGRQTQYAIELSINGSVAVTGGGSSAAYGIGINSTSAAGTNSVLISSAGNITARVVWASIETFGRVGYNFFVMLEQGGNTGVDPTWNNSLLTGDFWC